MSRRNTFTIGVEEELFIVDSRSYDLVEQIPESLFAEFDDAYPGQIVGEFLASQVEIISTPCQTISELEPQLQQLRRSLIKVVESNGSSAVAAGTHPYGLWEDQAPSQNPRYDRIKYDIRIAGRRLLACGLHVHIGIEDEKERLAVNNAMRDFSPFLLALGASSPFWRGQDTGFNSYRASLIDGLPRGGSPPVFSDVKHYKAYLRMLEQADSIEDPRELWWDTRLSARFPTCEVRVLDSVTRLRDVVALASLTACLARYLHRSGSVFDQFFSDFITPENRWRAMRYPIDECRFILDNAGNTKPAKIFYEDFLELVQEDACVLECEKQLAYVENILTAGTSADRQRQTFLSARKGGSDVDKAYTAVMQQLVSDTKLEY